MRIVKAVLISLVGVVLGCVGCTIAYMVTEWIFSLLAKVPLVAGILSWPVDFQTYAMTGIVMADIIVGMAIASFFGKMGNKDLNISINFCAIIMGIINVLRYGNGLIQNISEHGFSFDLAFIYLFAFGTIIVLLCEEANN